MLLDSSRPTSEPYFEGYVFDGDIPLTGAAAARHVASAAVAGRAGELNGSFHAAWCGDEGVVLVSDRIGSRPLYFATVGGRALVSADYWGLARSLPQRTLSAAAAVELLTFAFVLGDSTLIDEIREAPPGAVTTIKGGRVASDTCWRYATRPAPAFDPDVAARALRDVLAAVGQRSAALVAHLGINRLGLNLTGGRDSRTLAAALHGQGIPLHTFTSRTDEREDRYAADVAHEIGATHSSMPMWSAVSEPPPQGVMDALCPTTAFSVAGHAMSLIMSGPWPADGYVSGHLGDVLTGSIIGLRAVTEAAQGRAALAAWDSRRQVRLSETMLRTVLRPEHQVAIKLAGDRMQALHLATDCAEPVLAVNQTSIEQRQRRFILRDYLAMQQVGLSFLPLQDNSWLDFWSAVPAEWLRDTRLYTYALQNTVFAGEQAALAAIPFAGKPLAPVRSAALTHATQRVRHQITNARARLGAGRSRPVPLARADDLAGLDRDRLAWLIDPAALDRIDVQPLLAHALRSIARASELAEP